MGENWFREGRHSDQPGPCNDAHRRLGFKPVYRRPAAHITNSQSKDRFMTIRQFDRPSTDVVLAGESIECRSEVHYVHSVDVIDASIIIPPSPTGGEGVTF